MGSAELLTLPANQFVLNRDGTGLVTVIIQPLDPDETRLSVQAWDLPAGPQSVTTSSYTSSSITMDAGAQWVWLFPPGIEVAAYANAPYRFWDMLEGGKELSTISCCSRESDIELNISGKHAPRAAIGDRHTGMVMIWDFVTGEPIKTIQVAEPDEFWRLYLSPDGERFVIHSLDTSVETWDVNTGQRLLSMPGPAAGPYDNSIISFSPDGKWLALAGCDGTVVVRDVTSGEVKLAYSGNLACTQSMAFSPDGKLFAVNAGARGLRILDFKTGQELLTLPGGFEVEFTPDGTRVISVTVDERGQEVVRMYLLKLEDIVALARTRLTRSLTMEECQNYLHLEQCPSEP
jgi:WD40 repeat protein